MKPVIFLDMDGVLAGFAEHYEKLFFRSAYKDDPFTIIQAVRTVPDFFRNLPVIPKGRELFEILNDDYTIVFLTSPMDENELCRTHKLEWIFEHFGSGYDVIFAKDKSVYVEDENSILIDDMKHNLDDWKEAGGTAIDAKLRIDDICEKIEEALYGKKEIETVKEKLKKIVVAEPTEKQKESGNYKKGEIVFKGLNLVVENVPGSIRFGFDESGRKWVNRMKAYYGYIKQTEGADGDQIDCYIGPKLNASRVFVINQKKNDGSFDEADWNLALAMWHARCLAWWRYLYADMAIQVRKRTYDAHP
jgi:hypothetical protein